MRTLPTLRQLNFLVALDERRHFARAAEACLVSQSTLSAAIQELEATLGVPLFERTRRNVAPTAIGAPLIERARTILKEAEDMMDAALAARDPLSGPLTLGVIPTVGPFLLPQLMPAIRRAAPHLSVYLREEQTASLLDGLESGAIDAAILALPVRLDGVETEDVAIDSFRVVFPRGHRFARLDAVEPADLATEDLLLLEDGHCLRDHALAACAFEGARRNVAFQGTSLLTLVQMVANGLGVTLAPEMATATGLLNGLDLLQAPLMGKASSRRIALAWRGTSGRRETYRILARILRETVAPRSVAQGAPAAVR